MHGEGEGKGGDGLLTTREGVHLLETLARRDALELQLFEVGLFCVGGKEAGLKWTVTLYMTHHGIMQCNRVNMFSNVT